MLGLIHDSDASHETLAVLTLGLDTNRTSKLQLPGMKQPRKRTIGIQSS